MFLELQGWVFVRQAGQRGPNFIFVTLILGFEAKCEHLPGIVQWPGKTTDLSLSHRVSPVPVSASLATTTISPALPTTMGSCVFPLMVKILPIRSVLSLVALYSMLSGFNTPENTRIKLSLPTNGSAVVLKTNAENGSFTPRVMGSSVFGLNPCHLPSCWRKAHTVPVHS